MAEPASKLHLDLRRDYRSTLLGGGVLLARARADADSGLAQPFGRPAGRVAQAVRYAMREPQIQIQPQRPTWDSSDLDEQVVKVHLDDDPKGPVVVETARGILWPAPMSRRQNRVEGRLQ